jgi:hypothetical protein
LRKHHDSLLQDHSKYRQMHIRLLENYYWDKMKDDCRRYATNCFICRRTKIYNTSKQDLLTSLSIFQRKWTDFSFDFVTKLSRCKRRNQVFEKILVIVDRLIKRKLYKSMTSIETQDLFDAFKRRVFCCYELFISLINDRDNQITAKLWDRTCNRYKIKNKIFSTHHLETDDQIENANKWMKNYLRAYVKYAQDDWVDHLSDAEFAANNYKNAFTRMISFFVDPEFHSRNDTELSETYDSTTSKRAELVRANKIIERQNEIRKWLIDHITWAQAKQIKHANRTRTAHFEYKVEDLVYVNSKNFAIDRQNRSLSSKNVDSWKIIRNIDNKVYELDISEHLKLTELTSIFHSWKLHLASSNSFSDQIVKSDLSILIIDSEGTDSHEKYELLKIVNCRETRRFEVQYKITFIESWDEWNTNLFWQSWIDFLNSKDAIVRYHSKHFDKSNSSREMTELNIIENEVISRNHHMNIQNHAIRSLQFWKRK